MELIVVMDLVQSLIIVVLGVLIYRQNLSRKHVEELLEKASKAASSTTTPADDAAVGFARNLYQLLSPLLATGKGVIHIEVGEDKPQDGTATDAQG